MRPPVGWLLAILLLFPPASPAGGEQGAGEVSDRIASLRAEGRYAEALAAAETLLAGERSAGDTLAAADAQRLVATLTMAAALPESDRRRLAEADAAERIIEDNYGKDAYAEAARLAERQIAIRSSVLGADHEEVALSLCTLAVIRNRLGEYAAAETLYSRALALQRAALPPNHPQIAQTLSRRALLYRNQGRYRAAEAGWREALAIQRRRLSATDPEVARTIQNLALALTDQGDFAGALPLLGESLAIKKATLGETSASYATTLGNLAFALNGLGETGQAEALYRRALATLHDALGDGHRDVANAREQLGIHLEAQGDHEAARDLIAEALDEKTRLLGPDHPDVAATMGNLATVLQGCGDDAEALRLHREACRVLAARLGPDHPRTLKALSALALFEDRIGAHAQAESLFATVLEGSRRIYPPDHPEVARAALNLSISLRKQRKDALAAPLMEEAVAIRRRALGGANQIQLASALRHEGALRLQSGDRAGAVATLREAASVFETARMRFEPGLARVTFLDAPYSMLAAALLSNGDEEAAWPAVEQDRGRALADLLFAADSRALTPEERETERALRRELGDRERELAALETAASRGESAGARSDHAGAGGPAPPAARDLDALREKARGGLLDAEARWAAFQREIAAREPVGEGRALPLRRVLESLPANAAIVGWLDAEVAEDNRLSWGYVVRRDRPVRWVPVGSLGTSDRDRPGWLDSLFTSVSDRESSADAVRQSAERLWKERWAPLEPALAGVTELIVVPAGPTAGIPIESLVDGEGRCLTDRFAVSYAPSATVFTWLAERSVRRERRPRALLVGDPPFSEEPRGGADAPMLQTSSAGSRIPESLLRAPPGRGLGPFPRLPGTRAEVAAIDSAIGPSTILLGPDASEAEMIRRAESKELAGYDVIHFATHAVIDEKRPERSALVLSQAGLSEPLASVLAGERVVDGFVTAKEILGDWRLDADLVTLSACESGLGRRVRGEGIVGFAHAFFEAGARSVLVSMWRVDDRATSLLMRRFYENRAGARAEAPGTKAAAPMSKAEALREAKRWLRDYRTAGGRRPYDHPYYWSSFILIGDAG